MRLRHIYCGYVCADVGNLLEYDAAKIVCFVVAISLLECFLFKEEQKDDFFKLACSVAIGVAFWRLGFAYAT